MLPFERVSATESVNLCNGHARDVSLSTAPSTDSADAAPPKTPPSSSLLPASSVKYVMRRAMGGDQDAITDESVEAAALHE